MGRVEASVLVGGVTCSCRAAWGSWPVQHQYVSVEPGNGITTELPTVEYQVFDDMMLWWFEKVKDGRITGLAAVLPLAALVMGWMPSSTPG